MIKVILRAFVCHGTIEDIVAAIGMIKR